MKKHLLALAFAAVSTAAFAEPVTLEVKDATDIQGTEVPEKPAAGTSSGEARHIQPLESLKIGDYSFSFTKGGEKATAPAYYYAMSTNPTAALTIRLYSTNTMTISAPAGTKMAKIEFTGTNGTKDAKNTASEGVVEAPSKTALVWTYAAGTESVTLTFAANFRITKMVVTPTGEGVEDPEIPEPADLYTFTKVESLNDGDEILFVADGVMLGGVTNILEKGYGYLEAQKLPADATATSFVAEATDVLKVAVVEGGYTFTLSNGKALGAKTGYNTFDTSADSDNARVWTVNFNAEGAATITNVALGNRIIKAGGYDSFGAYQADKLPEEYADPFIFKKGGISGVESVVIADENAPVEYYNLQGVRVNEPANGLYIRRQGNTATKVYIR